MIYLLIIKFIYSWFVGVQIYIPELKLLSKKYNYSISFSNCITYIFFTFSICLIIIDLFRIHYVILILISILSLLYAIIYQWVLAKINPKSFIITFAYQLLSILILEYIIFNISNHYSLFSACILGIYYRNNPFGKLHSICIISKYLIRNNDTSTLFESFYNSDYSNIGYKSLINNVKNKYDVTDYDIIPNKNIDVIEKVQKLINHIGAKGGGIIYFPRGKYFFNKNNSKDFIQINYSNIIIEGELDDKGHPISELINCCSTLNGEKNPWLSPFFITTGEILQKSNIFWGLQFKKKKNIVTRSASLADPGSDGTILTPKYATDIIEGAQKGSNILKVKDSQKLNGVKYILLGLYNTTDDGNLIKEILGVEQLRPEWETALRAGKEKAPSYQWLAEIDFIIDKHTIKLKQQLRRDCEIKYEPALYIVEMLENIIIKNIIISSKWNGLFKHHGFPFYYSIKQSQEMDYGWNAINMKRVAYGLIENVIIKNFTNPLYIMDSRNITVKQIEFKGYDGHQGIKLYEHSCDNLFEDITFYNHFADMLGGEGNAYGNVFRKIYYKNPNFKPVDFDFHGFSEGPMSPPSENLFDNIYGFRYIKSGGALYNQPACAQKNIWHNILTEGELKGDYLFISIPYSPKNGILKHISAIRYAFVKLLQGKQFSVSDLKLKYCDRIKEMNAINIPRKEHKSLFKNQILINIKTNSIIN